jgi:hypothetical protein
VRRKEDFVEGLAALTPFGEPNHTSSLPAVSRQRRGPLEYQQSGRREPGRPHTDAFLSAVSRAYLDIASVLAVLGCARSQLQPSDLRFRPGYSQP